MGAGRRRCRLGSSTPEVIGLHAPQVVGRGHRPPRRQGQFRATATAARFRLSLQRERRRRSDKELGHQRGEHVVTIDPHHHVRRSGTWTKEDYNLQDLDIPVEPQWQRCGAVHCIDEGPWIGTLVCCVRRSGHTGAHSMSLGDSGTVDYWEEAW
jgi:hypothetical protein